MSVKKEILFLLLLLVAQINYGQASLLTLNVQGLKQEIRNKEDLGCTLVLKYQGDTNLQISKYPIIAKTSDSNTHIVYFVEYKRNRKWIASTCDALVNPLLSADGWASEKLTKGAIRFYPTTLHLPCFLKRGSYRVKFVYLLNIHAGHFNVSTGWFYFKVVEDFMELLNK